MIRRPLLWQGQARFLGRVFLTPALIPLACLWRGAGWIRALLAGTPAANPVPVVCIGNAVLGGGGKTPLALYLAKVLQETTPAQPPSQPSPLTPAPHKVHVSASGYGGRIKKRQLLRVGAGGDPAKAQEHGDEACLLAAVAPVWVGRKRQAAIVRAHKAGAELVLVDDGLQNPHFAKDFSILCLHANYGKNGFGNGRVFPAGPLRTPIEQALAASDAVFCYAATPEALTPVRQVLAEHNFTGALWHGWLSLTLPAALAAEREAGKAPRVLAFAGIAAPQNFFAACQEAGLILAETVAFADHHRYRPMDLEGLTALGERHNATLVTTEKDAVRLPHGFALALPARVETPDKAEILAALNQLSETASS